MRSIHTIEEPPFAICFCAFYYIICRNSVQYVKEYLTNTQMVGYTENRQQKQRREQVACQEIYRKQPADERRRVSGRSNTSRSFTPKCFLCRVGCDGLVHVNVL